MTGEEVTEAAGAAEPTLWESIRDWIMGTETLEISAAAETAAIGVTVALIAVSLLFVAGLLGQRLSWLHLVCAGCLGLFLTVLIQDGVGLLSWVSLGLTGADLGATLFALGELALLSVMVYNGLMTGTTLVR